MKFNFLFQSQNLVHYLYIKFILQNPLTFDQYSTKYIIQSSVGIISDKVAVYVWYICNFIYKHIIFPLQVRYFTRKWWISWNFRWILLKEIMCFPHKIIICHHSFNSNNNNKQKNPMISLFFFVKRSNGHPSNLVIKFLTLFIKQYDYLSMSL